MPQVVYRDFSGISSPFYPSTPADWWNPIWPSHVAETPASDPQLVHAEAVDISSGRLAYTTASQAGAVWGVATGPFDYQLGTLLAVDYTSPTTLYWEAEIFLASGAFNNIFAEVFSSYSFSLFSLGMALELYTGSSNDLFGMQLVFMDANDGGTDTIEVLPEGIIAKSSLIDTVAKFRLEITPATFEQPSNPNWWLVNLDGIVRVYLNDVMIFEQTNLPIVPGGGDFSNQYSQFNIGAVAAGFSGFAGNYLYYEFGYIPSGGTVPISHILPSIDLEMCFGVAPSGLLGYRNWMKEHPNIATHWYLSDVGPLVGAEDLILPNDAGIYVGTKTKGRGLLPEWGLSNRFSGSNHVVVDYDFTGPTSGSPFSLVALVRPTDITTAGVIHNTGDDGGELGIDATGHFYFGRVGGTVATLSTPAIVDHEYLVIGVHDGTAGGNTCDVYAWDLTQLADPLRFGLSIGTATATAAIGPHGNSDAYIGLGFLGDIQGVACIKSALTTGELAEVLECSRWTRVLDARAEVPISSQMGLMNDQPNTRLAPVGTLRFALNNAENNTGKKLGYYSPGHANCRVGFKQGTPVRYTININNVGTGIQFLGALQEIAPSTGQFLDRMTSCTATDWMEEAAKSSLLGTVTVQNVRADEVIEYLLMRMDNKPHEINLQLGTDDYPIAFDSSKNENTYVQGELGKVALSEQGLIYISREGALVFENRNYRGSVSTVSYTLDNTMDTADVDASTRSIINQVKVTVHPRRIDVAPTTVLYQSSQRIAQDHGVETKTFLQFRDPTQLSARFGGLNVVVPLPSTHYTVHDAQTGGSDITGTPLVTVEFDIEGSGVYMRVDNQYGQMVYIDVQVLGQGVYNFDPVTVTEQDLDSIRSVGLNEVAIDMPYQTLVPVGQSAALQILNLNQLQQPRVRSVQFPARKSLSHMQMAVFAQVSTLVAIKEEVTGVDSTFYINGMHTSFEKDRNLRITWMLTPASLQSAWIMDVSVLDTSTVLGY